MGTLRAWLLRLVGLFSKRRQEADLAAELESHIQLHTDDNIRRGMSAAEARRAAVLALGGLEPTKELVRDRRGLPALEALGSDLRLALRMVARAPGFVTVSVITLALGIGANAAVFSVAHKLVLQPLPFDDLDRLVAITETLPHQGLEAIGVAPADYLDFRRQSGSLDAVGAYRVKDTTLTGGGEPERLRGARVSLNLLGALDVHVLSGRGFSADADRPGRDREVLLGHALWQRRFAGDPSVLGSTLILDGRAVTVVGILPPYFDFPFGTEIWSPLAVTPEQAVDREHRNFYVVARLAGGAAVERARAEILAVAARIAEAHPGTNAGVTVRVTPLRDQQGEFARPLVGILLGMAGFLLVVACANLANLLLARATVRRKEVAVRAALGASRRRIVQQLLAESLVLFGLAAAAGLVLSRWVVDVIKASLPPGIARFIPGWRSIDMDPRVLAVALGVAFATVLVFGLVSALQASRLDLVAAFRDGGPRTGGGRSRRVLVGAEVALALVLLVGAGMMVNGFRRTVRSVEVADPDAVLTMTTALPEPKYAAAAVVDFYDRVADGLRSLPDVRVVAVASNTPLNNAPNPSIELTLEGRPALAPGDRRFADLVVVSPEYFAALGVPLLAGRLFANGDGPSAPPVVILSAQAARRYWPDEDPVGKRLKTSATGDWITIAGVVADVRQSWFDREIRPQIYLPARQAPRPSMTFLLRTSSDPLPLAAAARARVHEVDRDQPVEEVRTLARLFTDEMSPLGFATVLMTVFGVVALALSAIGVYGVMAYAVAQRTHEIGVRMALGARRRDVLRLVVGQSLGTAAIGIAVGLPLAVALTRVMSGALFGVVAFEPVVLVGLVVLLLVTAVAATYVPTRRAVRVDPMIALRRE